jgi:hypothetical protein
VQALDVRPQVDPHLHDVALHLLDPPPQPLGGLGHARDVLAGLDLGGLADLLRAALGRLDDRLDLLAGLLGDRRGLGGAALQRLDLGRELVEVRVDGLRVVAAPMAREVAADDGLPIEGHGGSA